MPQATYILTTFSPAMFGDGATSHIRILGKTEAEAIVREQQNKLEATGEKIDRVPSQELAETDVAPEDPAPGTQLKPEAAEAIRNQRKPQTGSEAAS